MISAIDPLSSTSIEHWLFDLDGCLVDSFDGSHLRPHARDLLTRLRSNGSRVEIWSAGGDEYAERVAKRVGIHELIDAFWTKERGDDKRWTLPFERASAHVVCVDDQPDGVPDGVEKIAVFPYLGRNDHDNVLSHLVARADRHVNAPLSH